MSEDFGWPDRALGCPCGMGLLMPTGNGLWTCRFCRSDWKLARNEFGGIKAVIPPLFHNIGK